MSGVFDEQLCLGYWSYWNYVWGQTATLRNEKRICGKLQEPGVLDKGELAEKIPTTLKDAFAITNCLGEKYVWIDVLCIVQDDDGLLQAQLTNMHRIYAGATFTIVAADGINANSGLCGFRGFTSPRQRVQEINQLAGSEKLLQVMTEIEEEKPLPKAYDMRMWTFQEKLFSKRQLIFEDGMLRWECQCSKWYEDRILEKEVDESRQRPSSNTSRLFYSPIPRLMDLSNIVRAYNQKFLTFPEDAFPAFAGIQSMLHRKFEGGLLYGHPEAFFDIALSWRPIHQLSRRERSQNYRASSISNQLPSWSWTGWAGEVIFPNDQEFGRYVTDYLDSEGYTKPVCKWFTAGSVKSPDRREINSRWFDYKTLVRGDDGSCSLLPGWNRIEHCPDPTDSKMQRYRLPRHVPKYCYKYSGASYGLFQPAYWYPVRVLDSAEPGAPRTQTAFIFAKTTRAFLYGGGRINCNVWNFPARYPNAPTQVELKNNQGLNIGYLQLQTFEDLGNLVSFDTRNHASAPRVELVATCQGYTGLINEPDYGYEEAYRIRCDEEALQKRWKDCYFVLWIEWKNGVAYRRGAGAVTVEAWEREKEDDLVDLVLG
ncbi:MAG: hypothetical protein Q9227_001213 [Pyrenula ochraceoflavens]